jgi:hypothetical protein
MRVNVATYGAGENVCNITESVVVALDYRVREFARKSLRQDLFVWADADRTDTPTGARG